MSLVTVLIAASAFAEPVYMGNASYGAGSVEDKEALGGWGTSNNMPQRVKPGLGAEDKLSVVFEPKSHKVHVINWTNGEQAFPAQDGTIDLILEAKNTSSQWQPIEFRPSATCGNSYHRVFLPIEQMWTMDTPRVSGPFQTRLRYRLKTGNQEIYSNEAAGSIQLSQFKLSPEQAKRYDLRFEDGEWLVSWRRAKAGDPPPG